MPLAQKDLAKNEGASAKPRGLVWQSKKSASQGGFTAGNPDFSVLIVAESKSMRSMIRSVLFSFGVVNIQDAADGHVGLKEIRDSAPELIIVDQDMSSMNGLDFLRELRRGAGAGAKPLPVMVMASAIEKRQLIEIRDAGHATILSKPFTPNDFAKRAASLFQSQLNDPNKAVVSPAVKAA